MTMVEFTDHARKRMFERKVSKARVLTALKHPDAIEDEDVGIQLFKKRFNGRVLGVVVEVKLKRIVVITIYWI